MAIHGDFKGTTRDSFQLEKGGPRLKHNVNKIQARNAGDTDYVLMEATTPAENDNSNNVATTAYVQTELAGVGGGGLVISGTAPSSSSDGDKWLNTENSAIYTRVGTAWVEFSEPGVPYDIPFLEISRVGSAIAAATSVTIPTTEVGDLIVAYAFREESTTVPTVPSGWTTITTNVRTGFSNTAGVAAYKFATSTSESSGTWTNAHCLGVVVYRNASGIGNFDKSSGFTTSLNYPAVTVQESGSWILAVAGTNSTGTGMQNSPSGLTRLEWTSTNKDAALHDSDGAYGDWSSTTVTVGLTGTNVIVMEIKQPAAYYSSGALSFPSSPSVNDIYTFHAFSWRWTGTVWEDLRNKTSYVSEVSALNVECLQGNYFTKTIDANSTITFGTVPTGIVHEFILEINHVSGTITWPASIKWQNGGSAPSLTTGRIHLFTFLTRDGITWYQMSSSINNTP